MTTTFEDALKRTLHGVNTRFDEADSDLHHVVAAAARSLADVTNGAVTLKMRKMMEDENGRRYDMILAGNGVEAQVGDFFVPTKGYPIRCNTRVSSNEVKQTICKSKSDLEEYFANMASNPDSSLVTLSAYVMRLKV